ncbi:hypothetical protein ACPCTO_32270 [Streptomyces olivoreticuli]|uniref:hypothetical protein n=1 Tax=Streptomyces olivoreticuli TaxID=68246 RepID=UPI000E23B40F|nr:hypothetical protein [Streptomyces olivoreticuli]
MGNQTLAALTSGVQLKDWVITVAGNVFLIILIVRGIGHYAKREWGGLITHVMAGVVVAGFVYASDVTKTVLVDVWTKVVGT